MTTSSAIGTRRTGAGARLRAKWLTIVLFLLPALALYAVFVLFPIVQAAHYSLFKWNGLQPLTNFIGLKNYQVALSNDVFRAAVGNNLFIIGLSLAIQIPFSLGIAVLLNRRFPGRAIFRLIFFLPYVLSEAITGIVFSLMLRPEGLVDTALNGVGGGGLIQDWLGDTSIVMLTLFVIISWKYFGFHMIILLAGRNAASFIQLYLDQATSPAMGTAINEATVALFLGQSDPAKVCQAITDAAATQ